MDCGLCNEGLAGPGRCRDNNRGSVGNRLGRFQLELIRGELDPVPEFAQPITYFLRRRRTSQYVISYIR